MQGSSGTHPRHRPGRALQRGEAVQQRPGGLVHERLAAEVDERGQHERLVPERRGLGLQEQSVGFEGALIPWNKKAGDAWSQHSLGVLRPAGGHVLAKQQRAAGSAGHAATHCAACSAALLLQGGRVQVGCHLLCSDHATPAHRQADVLF